MPRLFLPLLVLTLALLGAAPASAAITLADPVLYPAGGEPLDLVVGDWNGDSQVDVATANNRTGDVSVLIADGSGGLGIPVTRPVGGSPTDIAAGDVDRDGNRDLLVATQNTAGVVLMRGLGAGSFGVSSVIPVGAAPLRVATGDVNGDGSLDIVATNTRPSGLNVTVVLGNGDGTFGAPTAYDVTSPPADVALGDVNDDGRLDIVTADRNPAAASLLRSNADGTFGPNVFVPLGGQATGLTIAELNGRAPREVAVTRVQAGVTVLVGDGQGGLESRDIYPTGLTGTFDVAASDLDADGQRDLAAYGSSLASLRNLGAAVFDEAVAHSAPSGPSLAAGDFDGDGIPDLALATGPNVALVTNTSVPPVPPPEVGERATAAPVSGTVRVRERGSGRFVELKEGESIPIGSTVDTRKGKVRITTATAEASGAGTANGPPTASGTFRDGIFRLSQSKSTRPLATLTLSGPKLRCPRSRSSRAAGSSRRRSRRLFGNARGRFRTRGRRSTATIRGTRWLVKDTCKGTLTVSRSGTVVVRDLVKKRNVTLKTGDRYFARNKRRR
jgi:hypothetical protein